MKPLHAFVFLGLFLFAPQIAAAETPTIELVIKEHRFIPDKLEVPAGVKFKLVVKNQDPTAEEFESYELNREKVIAPNSQAIIYIGPLEPGTYPFFGEFNQKTAQGKMIAK
jgi:hypothetical protein